MPGIQGMSEMPGMSGMSGMSGMPRMSGMTGMTGMTGKPMKKTMGNPIGNPIGNKMVKMPGKYIPQYGGKPNMNSLPQQSQDLPMSDQQFDTQMTQAVQDIEL